MRITPRTSGCSDFVTASEHAPLEELYRSFARERHRRNYAERMADPVRAARWRAQKRQWWREHRAKRPVKVLVAP